MINPADHGIIPGVPDLSRKVTELLQSLPAYSVLEFPVGHYSFFRLPQADCEELGIEPGSALSPNGGYHGCIYVEKPGQSIVGSGYGTHFDFNTSSAHGILFTSSHSRIENIRAGNLDQSPTGQLGTDETAVVAWKPTNFAPNTNTGKNERDLKVNGCWFYGAMSGVSASCESAAIGDATGSTPPYDMYLPSELRIENCHFEDASRQGVQVFMCDRFFMHGCIIEMGDKDEGNNTFSRGLRFIGSGGGLVYGNVFKGEDVENPGTIGVEISRAGYYSDPRTSRISSNLDVSGNYFEGFNETLNVIFSTGHFNFHNNICFGDVSSDKVIWFARIPTDGVATPFLPDGPNNKAQSVSGSITNNTAIGCSIGLHAQGRIGRLDFCNNKIIGTVGHSSKKGQYLCNLQINGVRELDRYGFMKVSDNEWICPDDQTTHPINIGGLKDNDLILLENNKLTAPTHGRLISYDGTGTVEMEDPTSNSIMPTGVFEEEFNPMRSVEFIGY